MERSDLLKINGGIFKQQGNAINDHAAKDVKVFVVGNPCNTNCLIAMHHAPDVPKENFYAMTLLDENRARSQLAIKAGVDVKDVTCMNIWGNHSSTQFPDFTQAKIGGKMAVDVINNTPWLENDFIPLIQKRGAAVIAARGASSAGSAANAAIGSVYHLTHDTAAGERYSVAQYSKGEYGIDEGLIFSFPTRTENGAIKIVQGIEHNAFAKEKIQLTLNELREECAAVKALSLI
jgi:malate dehydrogenase